MHFKLPTKDFWQSKKVFMTGHTGFKGSWLALWLQSISANVMGYSLDPPTRPDLYSLANVENGMKNMKGDVRDLDALRIAISSFHPDIVIHMAAQSLVRESLQSPVDTYSTNVMGTVNLLEAIRSTDSVKAVIVVTSDKCYEMNNTQFGFSETDVLGGYDPYSSSKACAELVTKAYQHAYFHARPSLGVATVRAGNVIGGGDFADDRLIPDIVRASSNNNALVLRYPDAIRPWQHVLEPLRGYLLLIEALYDSPTEFSGAWNFGPEVNDAKTVRWLTTHFCEALGSFPTVQSPMQTQPSETSQLLLNSAKAREKLQWYPNWNIQKALHETADWYQAYKKQQNMRDYTLNSIMNYMA